MAAKNAQLADCRRQTVFVLWALLLGLCLVSVAPGQRVQIPTPNPGAAAGTASSVFQPPPIAGSAPSTFASPAFSAAQPVIPPPSFDAYSGSGSVVAPPASPFGLGAPSAVPAPTFSPPAGLGQPQFAPPAPTFGQPSLGQPAFGQPGFGQQGAPLPGAPLSESLPFGWESGTYSFQQNETAGVRFTKFMQKLDGEYTHLFGDDSPGDLELNRVEVTSTIAYPLLGNIDNPLLFTPGFVANFFDVGGLGSFEQFEAFLDTAWFPKFNDALSAELGFRTGVWTDFNEVNSDSIRLLGRGVAVVRISPTAEVLAGVVYLDRERIKLLPVGGVRWTPSDVWQFDAVFPNPVARRRLRSAGPTEWWVFAAGEYGGGSWTSDFAPDGFDYNDIRISLGVEFETQSRINGKFEVGYAFEREFYFPGAIVTNFDETVMLRAGINL
ncbi:MAG: hypothetical protein AAGF31_07940 [Planctomycetota bacterium]